MTFFDIVMAVYLVLAIFALTMTYREQKRTGVDNPVLCLIGLAASVAWPLPLAAMLAMRTRRD